MSTKDFLPERYKVPQNSSKYLRFVVGENRFRILASPVIGWEAWVVEDGKDKPVRFRINDKPSDLRGFKNERLAHFWAMPVWNVKEETIQILEITQSGIQGKIENLVADDDWGSPLNYDLKVIRTGEKLDTEYEVNPAPKSEPSNKARELFASTKINLDKLFTNDNPFGEESLEDENDS